MKDLGELKYFLGLTILRHAKGMFVCQRAYALDLLAATGMINCKPLKLPMAHNLKLQASAGWLFNILTNIGD